MIGDAKAHYDCIAAFSETDFTGDLKTIDVPRLVMHGDDDQVVPIAASAELTMLLTHGQLKIYKGYPHGMLTTHPDVLNSDLLAFVRALAITPEGRTSWPGPHAPLSSPRELALGAKISTEQIRVAHDLGGAAFRNNPPRFEDIRAARNRKCAVHVLLDDEDRNSLSAQVPQRA